MKKILSILFSIIVTGTAINAQCTCGSAPNWNTALIKIGPGVSDKYKCGHQFTVTCMDTIRFRTGGYNCTGLPCTKKYLANVYTSTGVLTRTLDPFSFSSSLLVFIRPGTYKVTIYAFCNHNGCTPCFYYFTVRDAGCSRR
jgi:hypothetical protein